MRAKAAFPFLSERCAGHANQRDYKALQLSDGASERAASCNLDQHPLVRAFQTSAGVIGVTIPLLLNAFGVDLGVIEPTPQSPVET